MSSVLNRTLLKLGAGVKSLNIKNVRYLAKQRQSQEVQIPVPWGYVAGKWWGPENKRPILALHGWQDNCGTFDRLIPYLPQHVPVLAIDMPGHGHSSQFPSGMPYHNTDITILLKRLIQYFGWKKVTLMGHSLGAIHCYTYTFLFPDEVDFLVCIDGLHPLVNPKKYDRIAKSIEQFIKYDIINDAKKEPPSYAYDEMEFKISEGSHVGSYQSIDLESAKYILARNIQPSKVHPGKYYFKRDIRVKAGPLEMQDPVQIIKYASRITCPLFISKAEGSPFFKIAAIFDEVHGVLKKSSSDCQLYNVAGSHHVHLNQPENLGGLVSDFIEKHDAQDRSYGGIKDEIKVAEDVYEVTLEKLLKLKAQL